MAPRRVTLDLHTYLGWGPGAFARHTEELSLGAGNSTNNFGELWAIGMVLNDVARKARGATPFRPKSPSCF